MTSLSTCPCCGAGTFVEKLQCKDYTVSHETFHIQQCSNCGLLATNPRPDNNALAKYYESTAYISHTNKSASLIDSVYLIARKFALARKFRLINRNKRTEARILDYGCGTGEFLHHCKQRGWQISGVEPSDIARKKAETLNDQRMLKDASALNENQIFDVITLWHVLEHVPDLQPLIKLLKSKLQKTGTLFVAVPNHNSYDSQYYKQHWAGYDVPRHLWHFGQQNIQILAHSHGLSITEILPMKLDAYYVSMLSEKYIRGKSTLPGIISAMWRGLLSNSTASKTGEYSSLIYVIQHAH